MSYSFSKDKAAIAEIAERYLGYGTAISGAGEVAFLAGKLVKQLQLMEEEYAAKEGQRPGDHKSEHSDGEGGGQTA